MKTNVSNTNFLKNIASTKFLQVSLPPLYAEILAVLEGLRLARSYGCDRLSVLSDSAGAINYIHGNLKTLGAEGVWIHDIDLCSCPTFLVDPLHACPPRSQCLG